MELSNDRDVPRKFICVERNEVFQIKMENADKTDKNTTYGVVLYLNGQRVHGKKTMRRYGWF